MQIYCENISKLTQPASFSQPKNCGMKLQCLVTENNDEQISERIGRGPQNRHLDSFYSVKEMNSSYSLDLKRKISDLEVTFFYDSIISLTRAQLFRRESQQTRQKSKCGFVAHGKGNVRQSLIAICEISNLFLEYLSFPFYKRLMTLEKGRSTAAGKSQAEEIGGRRKS